MRIHTDNLSGRDLAVAAATAGAYAFQIEPHGSRKRDHAFEVALTGSSPYRNGRDPDWKAATWDEWGLFIAALFKLEPTLVAGPYDGLADFERQTRDIAEAEKRYYGKSRKGRTAPWLVTA